MKLDASANFDTFLDFVFPAISVKDPETVIQKLKVCVTPDLMSVSLLLFSFCGFQEVFFCYSRI